MKGNDQYARMGMAAMLPGMIRAHEVLGEEIERLRAFLGGADAEEVPATTNGRRNPWAGMSLAERRAEVARRMAVAAGAAPSRDKREYKRARIEEKQAAVKLHPRDPRHPGHAEWVETMRQTKKANWARMPKAQRKARLDKMAAAKQKAQAARAEAA